MHQKIFEKPNIVNTDENRWVCDYPVVIRNDILKNGVLPA